MVVTGFYVLCWPFRPIPRGDHYTRVGCEFAGPHLSFAVRFSNTN